MHKFKLIIILLLLNPLLIYSQEFPNIEGWQIGADVIQYNPENLWEYINGGADQFIDYGFESLQAAELSNNSILVTADIYDMKLPLNAFGIYMTQKPEDSKILSIGTESSISLPAQCLLLKDRYYVKIHVLNGELNENVGKDLLEAINKALPGHKNFPNEFSLLPESGRKKGSLGHVRKNFLGLSELNNCIFANYLDDNNDKFLYFAIIPESNNSPELIMKTFMEKWKLTELDGQQICYRDIPYKGFIGIIQKDANLLGVANVKDKNILLDRLKIYLDKR